jgi:two-component system chemotaxis response regulator CheB
MIKVLIVDDSAVVRQVLAEQLAKISGIQVMGTARDPIFAQKEMEREWPDVIILDIEMPRMDGVTFLRKIMSERPTPVIICSTLTEKGAEVTMNAMAAGAVDIITKPKMGLKGFLEEARTRLGDAVKGAARARLHKISAAAGAPVTAAPGRPGVMPATSKLSADEVLSLTHRSTISGTTDRVIAIGTSTGGTQALERVLTRLPRTVNGIVVVQHMPEQFTAAFANRLDSICQVRVKEAENGDRVIPGQVLIANGGKHMLLRLSGAQYRVEIKDGPLVSRHRPSVDVLFRSVANAAGPNALGVIMTGMGDDGARGLKEMRDAGARTVGQDEASCVVYGMPKEAMKMGGVEREVPLDKIPEVITAWH